MKKLSIIIVGRDDGYGDDELSPYKLNVPDSFVFRMKRTMEQNITDLTNHFHIDDIEYVVVDWSPIEQKYLHNSNYLQTILSESFVKNVIVHPHIVEARGWNPNNFYEYYAKNIGLRHAEGDYILVTNPDIIFSDVVCRDIYDAVQGGAVDEYYRPYSRIDTDNQLNRLGEGLSFPKNGIEVDEIIGTPAAGDFVLTTKNNFINVAGGYDEIQPSHFNNKQGSLDGNLVINLYLSEIKPVCLSGSIMHLDHAKPGFELRHGTRSYSKYTNNDNWGRLEVEIK